VDRSSPQDLEPWQGNHNCELFPISLRCRMPLLDAKQFDPVQAYSKINQAPNEHAQATIAAK